MSVFRRKGSPNYHYEFQINGARFRGSTGETTERKATVAEGRIRAAAEARLASGQSASSQVVEMTLGEASVRFWTEKGQHEANAQSVWYQLENLVAGLGKNTLLSAIGMSDLADYQARRRGEKNRFGRLPSNRSVNAEMPELLSRVYGRAASVWSDKDRGIRINTGPEKEWPALKLRVPKQRTRELSAAEEKRLWAKLRPDFHDVIEFAIISGLRRAPLILEWDRVDMDAGVIIYDRKSIQDEDVGMLPISDRMRQLLVAQIGRHRKFVWTYVAQRTRDGRKAGKRYPMTQEGLKTQMRRAVKLAGIEDWRVIHDLRHTAATRTLRASQNLKAVQKQLGHSDIASTARYAHVLLDDVRKAMDAANPLKSPTIVENDASDNQRNALK